MQAIQKKKINKNAHWAINSKWEINVVYFSSNDYHISDRNVSRDVFFTLLSLLNRVFLYVNLFSFTNSVMILLTRASIHQNTPNDRRERAFSKLRLRLWIRPEAPFSRLKPWAHIRKSSAIVETTGGAKLAWAESKAEVVVLQRAIVWVPILPS